jgi:hypothetical protein
VNMAILTTPAATMVCTAASTHRSAMTNIEVLVAAG